MRTLISGAICNPGIRVWRLCLSGICIIALLFLSGCSLSQAAFDQEEAQYTQSVAAWQGRNESDLIDSWGIPTSTYKMQDGTKQLTYHYVLVTQGPGLNQTYTCDTIFDLDQSGKVIMAKYEGAADFCMNGTLAKPSQ